MAASDGSVAGAARSDAVSFLVIAGTIIPGVSDPAQLVRFYDEAYSKEPAQAALYARWRALGAVGKADHVIALCRRAGVRPSSTLEVGCGDGALLTELHRRGFGGRLAGVEITEAAVEIARARPQIDSVQRYDGLHLPVAAGTYDLGILSHVLEHVPDPPALLAEVARACRAVVVEVPLEANWSARRAGKREHAAEVGHLQRLDRRAARSMIAQAGLTVGWELDDPLPAQVHRFFAGTAQARVAATVKWSVRAGLHRLSPPLARRLFTVHYACLCLPPGA
jgi:SAM-dependent methyltransferase